MISKWQLSGRIKYQCQMFKSYNFGDIIFVVFVTIIFQIQSIQIFVSSWMINKKFIINIIELNKKISTYWLGF